MCTVGNNSQLLVILKLPKTNTTFVMGMFLFLKLKYGDGANDPFIEACWLVGSVENVDSVLVFNDEDIVKEKNKDCGKDCDDGNR